MRAEPHGDGRGRHGRRSAFTVTNTGTPPAPPWRSCTRDAVHRARASAAEQAAGRLPEDRRCWRRARPSTCRSPLTGQRPGALGRGACKQVVYDGRSGSSVGTDASHPVATLHGGGDRGAHRRRSQYVTVQPDQTTFTPGQTHRPDRQEPVDRRRHRPRPRSTSRPTASSRPSTTTSRSSTCRRPRSATAAATRRSRPSSAAGMVTAGHRGAATISVTVNGVTGSTPVVVREPLTLRRPGPHGAGLGVRRHGDVAQPGRRLHRCSNVTLALTAPAAGRVTATRPDQLPARRRGPDGHGAVRRSSPRPAPRAAA